MKFTKNRSSLLLRFIVPMILIFSCETGSITMLADLPMSLTEVSGIEIIPGSDLFWVIEDSNNSTKVYGLNSKGKIKRIVNILNAENRDWEDLTSDTQGNLYIGDFGNNSRALVDYRIYKIKNLASPDTKAEIISFQMPKGQPNYDFEAFFFYNGEFYIFSKSQGEFFIYTVHAKTGHHTARLFGSYRLNGLNNSITSADISEDGKIVVLLNHAKAWLLTEFERDEFFSNNITPLNFHHASQKEGVCLDRNGNVIISDERTGFFGGHIYIMPITSGN